MPLYHTMGVRSLIAMSLIGGTFVCLPRYDTSRALSLIAERERSPISIWCRRFTTISSTLRDSRGTDVSRVRKLGFAGAPMTDGAPEDTAQMRFSPNCSSTITAALKSTLSPSIRTRRKARIGREAPESISEFGSST